MLTWLHVGHLVVEDAILALDFLELSLACKLSLLLVLEVRGSHWRLDLQVSLYFLQPLLMKLMLLIYVGPC